MKFLLLFLVLSASNLAKADIPFGLSCSDEYECNEPGVLRCAPTIMNLSLTAVSDRDVQGWVDQFQFSGVPSQYLPEKSSIVGEIQEQAGQTKIEFNNGGGDKLITLELSTTFYSDMIINYQVPLSRNLGEAQITNRKTGNSSTIKCQVNMKGY